MVRSTAGPPPSPFSPADWLAGSADSDDDDDDDSDDDDNIYLIFLFKFFRFESMVRSTAGPPPSPFSPADWLAGSAHTQRELEGQYMMIMTMIMIKIQGWLAASRPCMMVVSTHCCP